MRGVTLDDYLIHGPRAALDVIGEITGAAKIDITGLCLGGALTGMLAAYLAGTGDDRIGSVTLLNTMLDYSEPGVLGAFTDERTVARLEREMAEKGYLEGSQMAGTFDLLRANDLIFSYVVSGWLIGQDARPSTCSRGTATVPACRPPCIRSTCAACTCATSWRRARWSWPATGCRCRR